MTDAPERTPEDIFKTIYEGDFYSDYDQSSADLKVLREKLTLQEYTRADLAKPTVKKLEWTFESQTILRSFGEVFRYEVANTSFPHLVYQLEEQPDFKGWRVKVCVFGSVVYWVSDSYPRPDQAKAAAQTDYEQRILSALENNT